MKIKLLLLSLVFSNFNLFAQQIVDTKVKQNLNKTSATFEENKGQMKDQNWLPRPDVLYYGSQEGMNYYIKNNGVSFQLSRVDSWREEESRPGMPEILKSKVPDQVSTYRVDAHWLAHNPNFTVMQGKILEGYNNYYNVPEGVEPALFVKQYESVTLKNVWNGIDIHYYGTDGLLETDYLVAPGADYRQIKMEIKGAELSTSPDGHLIMKTPFGEIQEGELKVFQNGEQLKAFWKIENGNTVSFEIPDYNPTLALHIDPLSRVWGTYYGGTGTDQGISTTTDASGNVYLAGYTTSPSAIASGGHQNIFWGDHDAFIAKFNNNGVRQWSTYYGGTGFDMGNSTTTDASGNVYLAGETQSTAAIASGGHQNTFGGGIVDAFIAKFNSSGVRLWGSYYGGPGVDRRISTTTDASGNVYLAGETQSTAAIASGGHQNTYGGGGSIGDAFLVKFNQSGVRQWGTYYGGTDWEEAFSTATDVLGNVYLAGYTLSSNAIASGGYQNTFSGSCSDAFLVKFNSNGVRQWGTYYGSNTGVNSGCDRGYSTATDAFGNVYLAGSTSSATAIAFGGHQNTFGGGGTDAFLVKFNPNGIRLWGTYYGGNGDDYGYSTTTDVTGNVYLAGFTSSPNAIASGGHQNTFGGGGTDAFLVKFNSNGVRQWGTYFGGADYDFGHSTSAVAPGITYLVGVTFSTTAIASGGHQNTYGGNEDGFLVKFSETFFTTQPPGSVTTCVNTSVTLSLIATGTGLTYQWQMKSPSATQFTNIISGGTNSFSGVNSATLTIGNPTGLNGYSFQCVVCDGIASENSSTSLLNVYPIPAIQSQPVNVVACSGASASFTLNATGTGLTYQWQNRSGSSGTWSNCTNGAVYGGSTTNALQIFNLTGLNNYQYRCVVTNSNACSITSNTCILTVSPVPTITNQPVSVATCSSQATSFTISATGTGLSYQWQNRSTSIGIWVNCVNGAIYNGVTTNVLQILNPSTLNNFEYRCVVTNSSACSATSNTSILTVYPTPSIQSQPVNAVVCFGASASFTLSVSGTGLLYQWQNRSGSSGTWTNCSNGAVYSGSTTNTLQILNLTGLNNYEYRCIVTNSNACTTTSNTSVLTVNPVPAITNQPASVAACPTQTANFTVSAAGTGLTYQWQNRLGSSGSWTNCSNGAVYSGSTTNALQILNLTGLNNYQYRCVVTNSNACSTSSNAVTLTVYANPTAGITADGASTNPVTINLGDATSLVLSGSFNTSNPNIVWTPSAGLSSTTVANPIAYPSTSTTYTATFTNTSGCTQSVSQQVIVNPLPNNGAISVVSASGLSGFNVLDTLKIEVRLIGVTDIYGAYARLRYFGALAPYMTYVGYTAGTILGTGASVISTPPVASGTYGYDFGISKIGAAPGYSGTGTLYTFFFRPNNVPSSLLGSQVCFYVDNLTVNNASQGASVGLVNQGPNCFVFSNQANVWPGDLDNNKTVNTSDLLKIGVFYNNTGPVRPNASLQWVAQPTTLWGLNTSAPNSDAYKAFADGNGDGIINNADQISVGFNMGKIHVFVAPLDSLLAGDGFQRLSSTGNLVLTPTPGYVNSNQLPQQVELQVSLTNPGGLLNNLYGISFDITVDTNVFDLQNTTFDYGGSIFGVQTQDFLSIEYVANGIVSMGMTRFNNPSINGNGLLCKVRLNTYSSLNNPATNLVFNGTVVAANDSIGTPFTINPTSVQIPYGPSASIANGIQNDAQILLFPNPAGEILNLMMGKDIFVREVRIMDEMGRAVEIQTPNKLMRSYSLNTEHLATGIYNLQITTDDGQVNRKFVKTK